MRARVYTRPNWMHQWVWEATFADETLASCYLDHAAGDWDYKIRTRGLKHIYYGFLVVGVPIVFAVGCIITAAILGTR